jgi:hypothetical protein
MGYFGGLKKDQLCLEKNESLYDYQKIAVRACHGSS